MLTIYDYTGQGILKVELFVTYRDNSKETKSFNLFVLDHKEFSKKEHNINGLKIITNHTWEWNLGWKYGAPYYKIYKDDKLVEFEIAPHNLREYYIELHNDEYYLISNYERGAPWYQKILNSDNKILSNQEQMKWKGSGYTY